MTATLYKILEDMDGRMCYVDGRAKVKLSETRRGFYKAYKMPGCTIGDYFLVLSWLLDQDIIVE